MNMHTIIQISRPRFWLYLAGPYLIGLATAATSLNDLDGWWQWIFLVFFLFPANLLIYGVNDIYDYETDKLNPKKTSYELLMNPQQQRATWWAITFANVPLVALACVYAGHTGYWNILLALMGFLFFGIFYSAPPIRAKTKPFLDSLFNILYLFPGWFGFYLLGGTGFNWRVFLAGTFWVMAMHAYSAVPDIEADTQARIRTIATTLGARLTLVLCALCYTGATVLALSSLHTLAILLGSAYVLVMLISMAGRNKTWVFRVYTWFPLINATAGFSIFVHTLLTRVFSY